MDTFAPLSDFGVLRHEGGRAHQGVPVSFLGLTYQAKQSLDVQNHTSQWPSSDPESKTSARWFNLVGVTDGVAASEEIDLIWKCFMPKEFHLTSGPRLTSFFGCGHFPAQAERRRPLG
ncbi:unnamed protein product [Effrenium voratum]|nr:unnamed protein product [Effrenium voratum]